MRSTHLPGRPLSSTAPRKLQRRIAPAKLQAKIRTAAVKVVQDVRAKQRCDLSVAVIQHLETAAEAHCKRRAQDPQR
jgi:hypothetical protein